MECALLNVLEQGERILVVQNGLWGQRAAALSKRLRLDVNVISVPNGKAVSLAEFKDVRALFLYLMTRFRLGASTVQTSGRFRLPRRVFHRRIASTRWFR